MLNCLSHVQSWIASLRKGSGGVWMNIYIYMIYSFIFYLRYDKWWINQCEDNKILSNKSLYIHGIKSFIVWYYVLFLLQINVYLMLGSICDTNYYQNIFTTPTPWELPAEGRSAGRSLERARWTEEDMLIFWQILVLRDVRWFSWFSFSIFCCKML